MVPVYGGLVRGYTGWNNCLSYDTFGLGFVIRHCK